MELEGDRKWGKSGGSWRGCGMRGRRPVGGGAGEEDGDGGGGDGDDGGATVRRSGGGGGGGLRTAVS